MITKHVSDIKLGDVVAGLCNDFNLCVRVKKVRIDFDSASILMHDITWLCCHTVVTYGYSSGELLEIDIRSENAEKSL